MITRDPVLSFSLARARIPSAHVEKRDHTVFFKNTHLRCKDVLKSVTPGISYWISRIGRWGFEFETTSKGELLIRCGGVKIYADGEEVGGIVEEVFGSLHYGLVEELPSIVIDVGMNLGVAALFFASQAWCERVVAFEPLGLTFSRAQRNFALNPIIAKKIAAHACGLGDSNYEAQAIVFPGNSGLTSTVRRTGENVTGLPDSVSIRNVVEVLEPLITEAGDRNIHFKVDCEGGEAEIFAALPDNILRRLTTIMLEWHSQEILDGIVTKLRENCFSLFTNRLTRETGLLYAARRD
jgi:FkbM family methyltransferase